MRIGPQLGNLRTKLRSGILYLCKVGWGAASALRRVCFVRLALMILWKKKTHEITRGMMWLGNFYFWVAQKRYLQSSAYHHLRV